MSARRPAQLETDADADVNTNGDADAHIPASPTVKRRKTRKGTRSCWACKRRKEKCIFDDMSPPSPAQAVVCLGCQRRGTRCVSQAFPDDSMEPPAATRQMTQIPPWVDSFVEKLIQKLGSDGNGTSFKGNSPYVTNTPASTSNVTAPGITCQNRTPVASDACSVDSGIRLPESRAMPSGPIRLAQLSRILYDALPTLQDIDVICRASYRSFYMFTQTLTASYESLGQSSALQDKLLVRPAPNAHPVSLAKHALLLMHLLQQFHPNYDELQGLSEPPEELLQRLEENAINRVSTQDRLLGSVEGLECVMLECMYYANGGNLRLSWAANRRALHLAQLMGFHQTDSRLCSRIIDPQSNADPRSMWFHIIQYDCSLSLLLGLPRGFQDHHVDNEDRLANETSLGRLERIHCDTTAQILDRNASRSQDFGITQKLDLRLQTEARRLPSRWWLSPNLSNKGKDDESLFWDLKRLIVQMSHFNILNKLHLPYMLRAPKDPNYQYSKMACVNASREILSRFITLRNFNRTAFCCRTPDFMALMAAMTLVLAHLDSHRQASDLLVHQYLSDRAMMEQAQESMEELSRVNGDSLSTESADLLRRLLIIEAEAAAGHKGRTEDVSVQPQGLAMPNNTESDDSDGVVRVVIPYFGVIKITREGSISKEDLASPQKPPQAQSGPLQLPKTTDSSESNKPQKVYTEPLVQPSQFLSISQATTLGVPYGPVGLSTQTQAQFLTPTMPNSDPATETSDFLSVWRQPHHNFFVDPCLPGLTAGTDEWTFQGADMAFFDDLVNDDNHGQF